MKATPRSDDYVEGHEAGEVWALGSLIRLASDSRIRDELVRLITKIGYDIEYIEKEMG